MPNVNEDRILITTTIQDSMALLNWMSSNSGITTGRRDVVTLLLSPLPKSLDGEGLANPRYYLSYPSNPTVALPAGVVPPVAYTVGTLASVAVGEGVPVIYHSVTNASARQVLQQHFVTDGRSFFTVIDNYLRAQVTATASLADNDLNKRQALGAWTKWDMGNLFPKSDPLVAAMVPIIQAAGGVIDIDALYVEASQL